MKSVTTGDTIELDKSLENNVWFKSKEERQFYIELAVREKYSKRELERQMDSGYYERYMLSSGESLPATQKAKERNT